MTSPASTKDLLQFYHRRALGNDAPPLPAPPRLTIVHAHAEVVKSSEAVRKLAGQESGDGGRKT
jgi:hypothetical protein